MDRSDCKRFNGSWLVSVCEGRRRARQSVRFRQPGTADRKQGNRKWRFRATLCVTLAMAAPGTAAAGDIPGVDSLCFWEHRNRVNITGSGEPDVIIAEWIRTDRECAENGAHMVGRYKKFGVFDVRIVRADGIVLADYGGLFPAELLFQTIDRGNVGRMREVFEKLTRPEFHKLKSKDQSVDEYYDVLDGELYNYLYEKQISVFTISDMSEEKIYYYDKGRGKLMLVMVRAYP